MSSNANCPAETDTDCTTLFRVTYAFATISLIVYSVFLVIVSYKIFKRRQFMHMAKFAKISFLGYIVQCSLLMIYHILDIISKSPSEPNTFF